MLGALRHSFSLGGKCLVGVEASLALGLASARGESNPFQFPSEGALADLVGLLFLRESGFLLLEPRGVVALPRDALAAIEFQDPTGHVVEEVPVVSHRDDGAVVLAEESFQPRDGLGVQVVGGFVEQQQIGAGEEQATQRDPAPFPTGEHVDRGVAGREAQRVHRDVDGALEVPGVGRFDLFLELRLLGSELVVVGVGVGPTGEHGVVAFEQGGGLADPIHHIAQHVLAGIQLGLLMEHADGETGREPRLAGEAVVLPSHDAQEARLSGAVRAEHADFGAWVERQVDVLEHLSVRRVKPGQVAHREDELSSHGSTVACHDYWVSPGGLSATRDRTTNPSGACGASSEAASPMNANQTKPASERAIRTRQ